MFVFYSPTRCPDGGRRFDGVEDGRLADRVARAGCGEGSGHGHYVARDRALRVVAESDTFYRSSEVQLDGADSDGVNTFEFRDLPSGLIRSLAFS